MGVEGNSFRNVCAEHGIAVTHQRQVLYEVMLGMNGHPSPEEVYVAVRRKIPAISLATVYKNIHLFVQSGVLREVSMHHGSQRVEMNQREHYHLVCWRCRAIEDFAGADFEVPMRGGVVNGFLVERCSVDLIGLCAKCQAAPAA